MFILQNSVDTAAGGLLINRLSSTYQPVFQYLHYFKTLFFNSLQINPEIDNQPGFQLSFCYSVQAQFFFIIPFKPNYFCYSVSAKFFVVKFRLNPTISVIPFRPNFVFFYSVQFQFSFCYSVKVQLSFCPSIQV